MSTNYFIPENAGPAVTHESPSGKYRLVVTPFTTAKCTWSYSQGCVYVGGAETPIATVQRNYSAFPYLFIEGHPNGHDYLVAGEDYQGQTVVELDTGRRRDHLPDAAKKGVGFCWSSCVWLPEARLLVVKGCLWAYPYEFRLYDFADPMTGWPQLGEDLWIDTDQRHPLLRPDGTIRTFQTEYVEDDDSEDEEEPRTLPPVAAFTDYRREGLKLVQVEEWVSEKEQERRRARKESRERHEKWWTEFKVTDPLYLAMPRFIGKTITRVYRSGCLT